MIFNNHSDLVGQHSFLSASKYHWVNYTEAKLSDSYRKFLATQRGTELHDFACRCIRLRIKLPKTRSALNMYVNDAIGFRLTPEQPLYYSPYAFGTADSIGFKDGLLRIHDLKTGVTPTNMMQLGIYAAYFCLEYDIVPTEINFELRIYQGSEINRYSPAGEDILEIMEKIVAFNKEIERITLEETED